VHALRARARAAPARRSARVEQRDEAVGAADGERPALARGAREGVQHRILAIWILGCAVQLDKSGAAAAAEVERADRAVVRAGEQQVRQVRREAHPRDGARVRLEGDDRRLVASEDVPQPDPAPRVTRSDEHLGRRRVHREREDPLGNKLRNVVLRHRQRAQVHLGLAQRGRWCLADARLAKPRQECGRLLRRRRAGRDLCRVERHAWLAWLADDGVGRSDDRLVGHSLTFRVEVLLT